MGYQAIQELPRVVVAGVGAVTSQGPTADALWDGVKSGRVAIRPLQTLATDGLRTTLGAEVQDSSIVPIHEYRHPAGYREKVIDFALRASEEALAASKISTQQIPGERWGIVVGTCNAGLLSFERWYETLLAGGHPDPVLLLLSTPQALAEALSGAFAFKGPVLSVNTACAAGANALGYAADLIRFGHADAVLTGGSEALSDILFAGFNALESLSPEPAAPYCRLRQGLSLGEGSGMMVLVREDMARALGTPVLAELLGYGLSADGYHPTAPHPEGKGAARAIRAALAAAGVAPEEVGYVNSHGTGTSKNDPAETKATRLGLGSAADRVAVSSTKSMIGHLLGAAGAVEGVVTIRALTDQVAPPTANYRERDPECDLDYVPNVARPLAMDVAISNNFAFGGANATIVLARAGARPSAPPRPDFQRVVITGLSMLTSAGCEPDEVLTTFLEGRDPTQLEHGCRIGRVPFDPAPHISPRDRRRMDRLGQFGVVATKLALQDAGLEISDANRERTGVIFATGLGPTESMENFSQPLFEEGPAGANPALFPNTVYNAAGGQVAMVLGVIGPTSTVTTGHAAGSSGMCYSYDIIACQRADAMVSLSVDMLTDTVIRAYRELGFLTPEGGPALAEAGIGLVLEGLQTAEARGARIYGEMLSYSITSDALGVGTSDPQGEGLEQAMRQAMNGAGVGVADITAIWASATGNPRSDAAEAQAIQRTFGNRVPVMAPKRLLGEPIGAGGTLDAALALKMWQRTQVARGPVLINSRSAGGTNLSLVLVPYSQPDGVRE